MIPKKIKKKKISETFLTWTSFPNVLIFFKFILKFYKKFENTFAVLKKKGDKI